MENIKCLRECLNLLVHRDTGFSIKSKFACEGGSSEKFLESVSIERVLCLLQAWMASNTPDCHTISPSSRYVGLVQRPSHRHNECAKTSDREIIDINIDMRVSVNRWKIFS